MFKKIMTIGFLSLASFNSLCAINLKEKMYFDAEEFEADALGDAFHIHIGNNVWLETNSVHRDGSGMFAYQGSLRRLGHNAEYEKKWKCPYCYHYWPLGRGCGNSECPSRYK
jgi:hypothetical protein